MKLNHISAMIGAIVFGLSNQVMAAPDQGRGTVDFFGSIIDAPCSIAPESGDQTVEMGQVANTTLIEYGAGTPQDFNIKLVGCSFATAQSVDVTFQGATVAGNPLEEKIDNIYLQLDSINAKGAGIKLRNKINGETILIGQPTTFTNLMDGTNELKFSATVERVAELVEPGEFTSTANFVLAYQ